MEPIATTDRLTLREWGAGDAQHFAGIMNTPPVMRWLGGVQSPDKWHAAYQRIIGFQREFGHTFWIVERSSDHEMLGFCGLKRVNSDGTDLIGQHEIGWRFRESSWGQGYAREAATVSLDLAFGRFDAPHVVAFTVAGNVGSWRLMERLGMTHRADLDYDDPRYSGELNPTIVYRITRDEWLSARSAR